MFLRWTVFIGIFAGGWLTLLPFVSHAAGSASASLNPSVTEVKAGERFAVDIFVQPNGEALDTVRLNLKYPADLLSVDSFALGNLFERSSPGNSVNEDAGELSQGGFTLEGPVTAEGVFGTVTFLAEKAGRGEIEILGTSRLISGGIEKIDTGSLQGATVTIVAEERPLLNVLLTSTTHSDQERWYQRGEGSAEFSFTLDGEGEIARWLTAFDRTPEGGAVTETADSPLRVSVTDDGIWYFHVKGVLTDGTETATAHYKLQIDSAPPNAIVPTTDDVKLSDGEGTTLYFGTTDDLSGISHYEVSINGSVYERMESPVEIEDLAVGDYAIEVKAVDKAENVMYGRTAIRVYPTGVIPPKEVKGKEALSNQTLLIILAAFAVILAIIVGMQRRRRIKS
jgi:hypothetical protein